MAVGYRTILDLEPQEDVLGIARDVVTNWVHEKAARQGIGLQSLDLSTSGIHQLGQDMAVTTARLEDEPAQRTQQVFRLIETNETGRWQVTIIALAEGVGSKRQQSLMVEVNPLHMESEEAIVTAKPPRLIRDLLRQHRVHSGGVRMTELPRIVDVDGIDEVLEAINDADRSAAVVVAASLDGVDMETWRGIVASLLRESMGVATGFALTVEAAEALNRRLPYGFHVRPGGIRTFAPGADITDDTDQYRHRYLGPQAFGRHIRRRTRRGRPGLEVDSRFATTHAKRTRQRFLELSLPTHVRNANDLLRAAELRVERQHAAAGQTSKPASPSAVPPQPPATTTAPSAKPRLQPEPEPRVEAPETQKADAAVEKQETRTSEPPEAPWFVALQDFIASVTGSPEVSVETLAELAATVSASKRTLEVAERQLEEVFEEWQKATDERDALRRELDDVQIETRIALDSALDYQRRFEHYQRALVEAELYADLAVPDEETSWEAPENFDEFLLRVNGDGENVEPVSDYVVFTGDRDAAMAVDDRDQTSRYVRHMWDFVKVLHDFASVRDTGFAGDVRAYLNSDEVLGHKCTHRQHAANESETVRSRKAWRDERLFPVPTSVHPEGKVHMMAHFRPSRDSTYAPRMHYYDDTENTGKVYIGYIGKHLTTTKTASV